MLVKLLKILLLWVLAAPAQAVESNTSPVIDLSSLMQMDQLIDKVASSQVIFVSETHTRFDHHLNQLAIIDDQHQRHDNLAIGLEFIQQPFQSVLDDFIAGRIDEEAMLRGTEYFERWSYDYRLYRPIFNYAREHGIALIALNIDSEIIDSIKQQGMQGLNEKQQAQLPREIDRENEGYRKRLMEVFKQHPNRNESEFESFLEIQLLWDESMASRAARWFSENPDGHMVVLAGSGHIMYGDGIPNRLKRRQALTSATVINLTEESPVKANMGDFIIMSEERTLTPSGKMGIILDNTQSPPLVIGFTQDSHATHAGLEKDDRIIRIDERQISNYFDVRMALLDKDSGQEVIVEITRDGFFTGPKNHQFKVLLK